MNTVGGHGLWDDDDGFYYDQLRSDGSQTPLKVRSLVGLIPLIAVTVLEQAVIAKLPGFQKRMRWFLENRRDLADQISYMQPQNGPEGRLLLAIPSRERLERVLRYMLDENEFLSPYGIRSVSRYHLAHPFSLDFDGERSSVDYEPGGIHLRTVRRQFQLARPDLVPDELSPDRSPGTLPPFLRRPRAGGVSHRVGQENEPGAGGARTQPPPGADLPARPNRAGAPGRAASAASPTIRTGRTWCCSTNTSTATTAQVWEHPIKPAGLPSWCARSKICYARLNPTVIFSTL